MIMLAGLGFLPHFEFSAFLGSIALGVINYLSNFDKHFVMNPKFILINFLALGLLAVGIKAKN